MVSTQIDYKSEVCRLLPIGTMIQQFGLTPNRGFIKCPFHTEDTASLRIYPDSDTFYCFGCGAGGNVIDFAMKWYNLGFYDTINKLNSEFSLGLPINRKVTLREKYEFMLRAKQATAKREQEQRERDAVYEAYYAALDTVRMFEKLIARFKPPDKDAEPNPVFGMALCHIENARYELEEAEGRMIAYGHGK